VCASCEEETNHPGFTNEDSDGIGYCDSDAYGYEAKNSGLVVFPTDDEGTILPGALSVSAWAHVTVGQSTLGLYVMCASADITLFGFIFSDCRDM
jgi:hypothetical protein